MLRALLSKNLEAQTREADVNCSFCFADSRPAGPQLLKLNSYHIFLPTTKQTQITHIPVMGREEQTEEREVLDSIFPDEITGSFLTLSPSTHLQDQSTDHNQTSPKPNTAYPSSSK